MMTDPQNPSAEVRAILDEAWQVRDHAHADYSHYKVGAAIKDEHGRVHVGCNVENAAYTA